jgi:hypothetical protein
VDYNTEQTLETIGTITGFYSIIYYHDGSFEVGDIMNFEQISNLGIRAMKGTSPAHKNFPRQKW